MQDFKAQSLKTALKELLKKKGLIYEDLAREMECSVPTIKRILGPEELTLSRLLQLCEILDVSLSDLEALAKDVKSDEETFSAAQQEFLAKNRHHFAYLLKLYDGKTPKQIAETFGLNARSTDKYLIALERHELIHVTGRQKVRPAFKRMPTLGTGSLGRMHFEGLIRNSGEFFVDRIREAMANPHLPKEERNPIHFATWTSRMTKETFKEWEEEREKLRETFSRRAEYEEKTKTSSELMNFIETQAYTLLPLEHPALQILEKSFGAIPNL